MGLDGSPSIWERGRTYHQISFGESNVACGKSTCLKDPKMLVIYIDRSCFITMLNYRTNRNLWHQPIYQLTLQLRLSLHTWGGRVQSVLQLFTRFCIRWPTWWCHIWSGTPADHQFLYCFLMAIPNKHMDTNGSYTLDRFWLGFTTFMFENMLAKISKRKAGHFESFWSIFWSIPFNILQSLVDCAPPCLGRRPLCFVNPCKPQISVGLPDVIVTLQAPYIGQVLIIPCVI